MIMEKIEVLLNAILHVGISISLILHIHKKDYELAISKFLFIVPLWTMFLGFYYLRTFIDGNYEPREYSRFLIFETITNGLFWGFIIFKNYKLKKQQNEIIRKP